MIKEHFFRDVAGSIPGIPGTFAGVRVVVDEETQTLIAVTNLDGSPLFEPEETPTAPLAASKTPATDAAPDVAVEPPQAPEVAAAPAKQQKAG